MALFATQMWAVDPTQIYANGYENGAGEWSTNLTVSSADVSRTGEKSIKGDYTGSTSAKNATQNTGCSQSSSSSVYCHIIGYAKAEAGSSTTAQIGFTSSKKSDATTLSNSTWTKLTYSSNSIAPSTIIIYKAGAKTGAYFDDIVAYYSESSTIDLTAPSAATNAVPTVASISWTNGEDTGTGATGIQNTLIWHRTNGSANDLTLNNQGIYSLTSTEGPNKDQSGNWTLVSASVAADAESYSGTFTPGDVYAIVHRDLAYNYSTPTYVTIQAATAYDATFDNGGHGVAPSKAEGVSFVVLEEITGVDGWIHTGWKADVATQKGNTGIPANTLIENGETIVLLENTTFTAQWQQISESPTITTQPSTSAVEYPRGETAAALSVEATGAGTLSYQWYSNTEAATTGENLVEIDGATNASYTPSTTTLGTLYYFCAVTNTETSKAPTTVNSNLSGAITVVTNPLGEHTLTWTVRVESNETTITTTDKTPTSTHLGSMSNIAINGGLTVDNSGKNGGTGKIKPTNGEKVAANYLSMTFTVADGYTFTPTTYTMSTTAVSAAKTVEVEISDTHGHSKSATWSQPKTSSTPDSHNYDLSGSAYEGVVTLKIYVYNDEADNGYRLGSSIVLAGTVAAIDYNVNFAAGEGSGTMDAVQYHVGDEVTLPACTFVAPDEDHEFDAWTSNDVTILAGKFTMPAKNVTVTATWKEKSATALDNTDVNTKAVKRLENGMLVIEKNGVRYNAQGQIVR